MVLALLVGLTLGEVDGELRAWVDEGRTLPDEQVGKFAREPANQVAEFTVMSRVRGLQETLSQSELDAQAAALGAQGADTSLPVEVRRRAWFAACHFQRSQLVPALIQATEQGPLPLRVAATMCLGRYGTEDLEFHRTIQKGVLVHVAFASHPNKAAHEAALALAESPVAEVRSAAWQSLAHFVSPSLLPLVARQLSRKDTTPAFLQMLSAFRGRAVTDYLLKLVANPSVEVRRATAAALAQRASEVPRRVLLTLATDADDAVSTSGIEGLRRQRRLPLSLPQIAIDRAALKKLVAQHDAPSFHPPAEDRNMPPEVSSALELRAAGRSAEAADRLKTLARKAGVANDFRTMALALHRAGDAFADDRDCSSAVDAYWQALVMHELRGDSYFAGVAANDLGLLWFKCSWHVGSASPELFSYVVSLRRTTNDQEGLRKAVNNYASSLIGLLVLDEAGPVIAESLSLAQALKDPAAERKARINELTRQGLYCTELAALRVRVQPDGDGAELPDACLRRADGSIWFRPEAEARLREAAKLAVEAAGKTNVNNDTLCAALPATTRFVCEWFPKQSP